MLSINHETEGRPLTIAECPLCGGSIEVGEVFWNPDGFFTLKGECDSCCTSIELTPSRVPKPPPFTVHSDDREHRPILYRAKVNCQTTTPITEMREALAEGLKGTGKVELPPKVVASGSCKEDFTDVKIDKPERTRGKSRRTPARVLPTIVDALAGLEPEEIKRVLSAAAIMTGVANFESK